MKLPIKSLNLDFQPAENIGPEIVERHLAALRNGKTLAPVRVFSDGKTYWLIDGFHRVEALRRLKIKEVEAKVVPGTLEEANKQWNKGLKASLKKLALEMKPVAPGVASANSSKRRMKRSG